MLKALHDVTAAVNTPRNNPALSLDGMNASDRLARLMAARGIESREELGRLTGLHGGTVRQHLSRGSISKNAAGAYARVLRCSVDWLLFGRGPPPTLDVDEGPPFEREGVAQEPGPPYKPPAAAPRGGSIADELSAISREIERLEEQLRRLRERVGTL